MIKTHIWLLLVLAGAISAVQAENKQLEQRVLGTSPQKE